MKKIHKARCLHRRALRIRVRITRKGMRIHRDMVRCPDCKTILEYREEP